MRSWTIVSLILLSNLALGQRCVKGDIEYSMATYSDELFIDKRYGSFLDSLLKTPVFEYFRDSEIKNLPTRDKDKPKKLTPSESHVIEPLFIDMSTFNGVYAKRIWQLDPKARRPTRFRRGFYHRLFLISDNRYIELTDDTIKNERMIKETFRKDFSEPEIYKMAEYFNYSTLCEHFTFFPPFYIKRGDEILFDSARVKGE